MTASPRTVGCDGVEFRHDGLWSLESGARRLVPAEDIQLVTLRRGVESPRPLTQTIAGIVVFAFGCTPLLNISRFLEWVPRRRFVPFYDAFVLPLTLLGIWLLWRAWRRSWFLEVQTRSSSTRVFFVQQPDPKAAERMLHEAGRRFGYSVNVVPDQSDGVRLTTP